ncbi:MAG: hypothetical protein RL208_801 [Pseudomonadota bacterium]|jgi:pyruvate dehydrogenase E1 component alpha subunit
MIDKNILVNAYKDMLLARRFEEMCASAYGKGLIAGFCHLYIGQEAIIAAIKALRDEKMDHVITSYRCHAHAILLGETPRAVMAELFGRETGSSKGKGGSMHIFSPENNFWGGHGIVGVTPPLGTGLAFAEKYKGSDRICYACLGDGAVNQGQVYEAFNMASLWNLPVLYVIENNKYSMGTCTSRHSASGDDFSKRGEPFGIKGQRVDGMDFEELYEVLKSISSEIRQTQRPQILQIDTYRYRGHSMSDPAKYRSKEEVEDYKNNNDCIKNIVSSLLDKGVLSQVEIDNIENEIVDVVQDAFAFAQASAMPSRDELFTDILY